MHPLKDIVCDRLKFLYPLPSNNALKGSATPKINRKIKFDSWIFENNAIICWEVGGCGGGRREIRAPVHDNDEIRQLLQVGHKRRLTVYQQNNKKCKAQNLWWGGGHNSPGIISLVQQIARTLLDNWEFLQWFKWWTFHYWRF